MNVRKFAIRQVPLLAKGARGLTNCRSWAPRLVGGALDVRRSYSAVLRDQMREKEPAVSASSIRVA